MMMMMKGLESALILIFLLLFWGRERASEWHYIINIFFLLLFSSLSMQMIERPVMHSDLAVCAANIGSTQCTL